MALEHSSVLVLVSGEDMFYIGYLKPLLGLDVFAIVMNVSLVG